MSSQKKLRIGVFIPSGAQLLDMSPVDLLSMLDPEYLAACHLPSSLVSLGTPSEIEYISTPETGEHVPMTAKLFVRASKYIEDPSVQPGSFHIILVPGPDPSTIFDEKVRAFLRSHAEWRGEDGKTTDILSVCTGCILLGQAGLLKGKRASGPRGLLPSLAKQFPDTTWVDDKRWVIEGNIWTSGEALFYNLIPYTLLLTFS
jgi:transcriptional regulator GlxA family with amidase domain